ncbi:carnitine O-palmitoyltransferase 1: liver isoform-like protein [Dinothrombium tinctorium]|uniref:carnitine O-palmitoyltransferase n=1 Tax=Dinothrombium tinctorium TaxID=1965070 RepID=A0A3S4RD31_9ACAR|nr:carnitine O-palmitoyltransferase 1: liver isoform-like protein [Dinothrombium tinctorium]
MAEAHQAVAFSFQITHEGVQFNYDWEVLHLVWLSGARSYRKRWARFLNNIRNGVYPSSKEYLFLILSIVLSCHFIFGIDPSFGCINALIKHLIEPYISPKFLWLPSTGCAILACLIYSLVLWFAKALLMQYILKALLMYKGWMYEARSSKGMSTTSKLWVMLVKALTQKEPLLYSYQASLPKLPVPSLNDTMKRYLRSVRPLCKTDEDYHRIEKLANDFQHGIGKRLQRYLTLKSWWSSNYVSDWWEEYVYLRGRQALMVNSNFYGIDTLFVNLTNKQSSRAANLVHACFLFRRQIDRQELKPILVQGLVPLCSWQYERMFNTVRIPGIETDKLVHYNDARHIVVLHKGKYYKLDVYYKGRLLQPKEIEKSLDKIIADEASALPGEKHLGALTATDRVTWANTRQDYFMKGINKISLDIIEKSAFVLVLDDKDFEFDTNDPSKLDRYGQLLLHGTGHDRWYDKSFNLVIGRNGRAGFNCEHSWADAPIIAHMWEFVLSYEYTNLGYDEEGRCKVGNGLEPPSPLRLKWDFPETLISTIETSLKSAEIILSDVDLKLVMFDDYGKGFMKKCKLSPDAYIQMCLQLAYFRDAGEFSLTYEASMTRLFREGRTETVRPVTIESAAWVNAMHDPSKTNEERIALLRHACNVHQRAYQDAMCGKGIDRHLFCLYVVSKYLELDSPFLKEVLSEPWKLSTSQTPHGQAGLIDLRKNPNHISAGGGFGPVADDGYGVSYIIAGEDFIFFHISSKKSSNRTDSLRFSNNLKKALGDVRNMFLNASK